MASQQAKPMPASLQLFGGTIAGLVATIPMTIFMLIMHRILPKWQRYALPPEEITKEMAERVEVRQYMDKQQLLGASLVSHFGYGATMGTLYATLTRRIALPPAFKGILFGLIIWAFGYLGWLPLAGFSEAATREPMRRNVLMIAAHIIWGSATGLLADVLRHWM